VVRRTIHHRPLLFRGGRCGVIRPLFSHRPVRRLVFRRRCGW
jgi:hypothetical protein